MKISAHPMNAPSREVPPLEGLNHLKKAEEIKKVAQDFASLFTEVLVKSMRNTVPEGSFIDGGNAEDIYRGMLDTEYSKIMAQNDSNGISQMIQKQLLKMAGMGEQNQPQIIKQGV